MVIHADDIGFSHASVSALETLLALPFPVSTSALAVAPWFPAAVDVYAKRGANFGVHFALTCEWVALRWRALKRADLHAPDGYLPRTLDELWHEPDAEAVRDELEAQLEHAKRAAARAGVRLSHLDDHMVALHHPMLLGLYIALGEREGLPLRLTRNHAQGAFRTPATLAQVGAHARTGEPFDAVMALPPIKLEAFRTLADLPAGSLTMLLAHPSADTAELRALAPDWQARVADLATLRHPDFARLAEDAGVDIVPLPTASNR